MALVIGLLLIGCTSTSASHDTSPTLAPTKEPLPLAECAKTQFESPETGPIPIGTILTDERDFELSHRVSMELTDPASASRFVQLMKSRRHIPAAQIDDPTGDGTAAAYVLHNIVVTRVGQIPPAFTSGLWVVINVDDVSPKRTAKKCLPNGPA
jgi:hypothetical protein